jgi:hypothetical protein
MIGLRFVFYVLYVILGAILLVRLLSVGVHWETAGGIVLALALMALGVYRIRLLMSARTSRPR